MPQLHWKPPAGTTARSEPLELRVSGVIYTLSPAQPCYVDPEHVLAVTARATAAIAGSSVLVKAGHQ